MFAFKVVFYKSLKGDLTKIKEYYQMAETFTDLIESAPSELFDILKTCFPVHGWVEIEQEKGTVFVIFVPRYNEKLRIEEEEFKTWLEKVKPKDFQNK